LQFRAPLLREILIHRKGITWLTVDTMWVGMYE